MRPATPIGNDRAQPIVFADNAHDHRERMEALRTAMAKMPDTSPRLVAAFGKWPGLFPRLCLTFHLIEIADTRMAGRRPPPLQVITAETAERVASYMRDIVLPHMLRAEAVMFSTDQTSHAKWVAGFILAHRLERITTRDIVRSYKAFKAPDAAREMTAVMQTLVSVGWLEPEEPSNLSKPVTVWTVNPAVHTVFAARAKQETERRENIKAQITDAVAWLRTQKGRSNAG